VSTRSIDVLERAARRPETRAPVSPRRLPGSPAVLVALAALAAGAVRLPFLGLPLRPDEAGYLLVASQWGPGSSTYGDYFLDRPPLLVEIFRIADALGGGVPLRLIGIVAVVATVLLAARLGGAVAAWVAAVFLSTPLFDAMEVDGELQAVPFVLGAIVLLVLALRGRPRPSYAGFALAGVLATCAVLVKQNMLDAFVVAAVLLAAPAWRREWRTAAGLLGSFAGGALATGTVALVVSAAHGTSPAELWDALVTFRAQAAEVISTSASEATHERFRVVLLALVASGAPLLVAASMLGFRRPPRGPDLRLAALACLAWEGAGVVLGGSYWLHYLIGLVPGLVLVTVAARPSGARSLAVAIATVSTVAAPFLLGVQPPAVSSDARAAAYLRAHSTPGDTVVIAYGRPDIVRGAGLSSPYEHLWSLSARVRDPQLRELTAILAGPAAPRWVVVHGPTLATWGVNATTAQHALDARYQRVATEGPWEIWERR
jgi:hypothetical protein